MFALGTLILLLLNLAVGLSKVLNFPTASSAYTSGNYISYSPGMSDMGWENVGHEVLWDKVGYIGQSLFSNISTLRGVCKMLSLK